MSAKDTLKLAGRLCKKALWLVLFGAMLLVPLTWLERMEEQEARLSAAPLPPHPVAVEAVAADIGPVQGWIVCEGTAQAIRKRHLQFEEAGRVVFVARDEDGAAIREGSRVRGPLAPQHTQGGAATGQLLAQLDTRDRVADVLRDEAALSEARRQVDVETAALSQARNDLAEAQTDLRRKQRLFDDGVLARSTLEQAATRRDNARDAVRGAEARLASARQGVKRAAAELAKAGRGRERTAIRAPFDGVVARMNIRQGDYFDPADVNRRDPAGLQESVPITLIDPHEMEIVLSVPEMEGRDVVVGQRAVVVPGAVDWFRIGADDEDSYPQGRVHAVSPQVDPARRARLVRVRLTQDAPVVLDGMFVSCWIAAREKTAVLRVPLGSLMFEDDAAYIYVAHQGTAHRRAVELGIADDEYAEVLGGLEVGERVVLRGRHALSDGHPLRIIPNLAHSGNGHAG